MKKPKQTTSKEILNHALNALFSDIEQVKSRIAHNEHEIEQLKIQLEHYHSQVEEIQFSLKLLKD